MNKTKVSAVSETKWASYISAICCLYADVASAILSCLQEVGERTLLKWRPDDSSAIWALMVEANRPITTDSTPNTDHTRADFSNPSTPNQSY